MMIDQEISKQKEIKDKKFQKFELNELDAQITKGT